MTDKKKLWIDYIPMALAAVLIIFFAVWRGQSFVKTLPTLITLAVQLMLVRASRYAFLVGGFNSLLYAVSYYSEGLYFLVLYAVAISMPMQIYSYFNWKRNSRGNIPDIRALSVKGKLATVAIAVLGWFACLEFFGELISSGDYTAVDSLIFVLGVIVTLLSAFRYVDSQYLNLAAAVLSLGLWTAIAIKKPENLNYVIIAAYNLFRGVETALSWSRLCLGKQKNNPNVIVREGE